MNLARGLGWFSIGIGVLELVAARTLARALGMRGNEGLVRLYGVREITKGIGILASRNPEPWIWARIAGDALDLGTLGAYIGRDNRKRDNVSLAVGNAAVVTALDVYCARQLSAPRRKVPSIARDYSDRRGMPRSPDAMRGAARDFEVPRDMRAPEAMRPYSDGAPPTNPA
jgi:hypothetical protein